MKGWIRLIAILLLAVLCLSACAPDNNTETPNNNTQTPSTNDDTNSQNKPSEEGKEEENNTPQLLDPANAVLLVENSKTEYAIVYDNNITKEANALINGFRNAFWTKTGADLKARKDNEAAQAKEILVYAMDDRREVSNMMSNLRAPNGRGYYIGIEGEKIVVACDDVMYLEPALELLLSAVRDCGNGSFGVQKGYSGKLDIPAPTASALSEIKTYYVGEGNYTVSVHDVTAKNYSDYCAALDREMEEYSTNQIGDNRFATYIKDNIRGSMAVYTMYYPKEKCYKITYGPLGYLPGLTATPEGGETVRPSITQNARDGCESSLGYSAAGMSSIVQLSDGRFILFDGGPYNAKDASTKDDLDSLYNLLKGMTPNGGKPVIAAWFFSHAHGDHMQLAVEFLEAYHGRFELQMVGHNFPDFDTITIAYESPAAMKAWVDKFYAKLDAYYPNAATWVCHTGEVLNLPGCKLEVVYTPEDYATNPQLGAITDGMIKFPWGNHACSVFRLTVNTTTFLVLGDAEKTLCEWMADNYGAEMKSDILSLSHHGLNGGELSFYRYIDPDICFWPIDTERMEANDCRQYDFNKYLLNIGGYGGRNREHYCADETKTIYC